MSTDTQQSAIDLVHGMTARDLLTMVRRCVAGEIMTDAESWACQLVAAIIDHAEELPDMVRAHGYDPNGMDALDMACHIAARRS